MSDLEVRHLSPADPEAFADWVEVSRAVEQDAFHPWHTAYSAAELTALMELDVSAKVIGVLGTCQGRAVAFGKVQLPLLDNLHYAQLELGVLPDYRRRGFGSRMLAELTELARAAGRVTLNVESTWPIGRPSPVPDFAASQGFSAALRDWRNDLDLPPGSLSGLLAPIEAQARPADYQVQSWVDVLPEEWAEQRAVLSAQLAIDAPSGEQDIHPEVWDVERVQQSYAILRAQGRRIVESIAIHRGTGQAVGNTVLVIPEDPPGLAFQWSTLVLRAHRGHRLGLALKAANLRSLRQHCPGVRRIVTWNAQENTPMLDINRRFGFVAVGEGTQWQKLLEPNRL